MAAEQLRVKSDTGEYPIWIGAGVLRDHLPDVVGDRHAVVITNDTVKPLYGEALVESLPDAVLLSVRDGEAYKNLDTIRILYDGMFEAGADRKSVVVALGGGVVGDMAGFVAATYMRGLDLIQCPTTLLAMVDSSIGGKTGVDVPQGKNLIGAFKDPIAIITDPATLATLPPDEVSAGMAEAIKSALIGDPTLIDNLYATTQPDIEIIQRTMAVKIDLVERDRLEQGERAFLNLGHTFGHALEHVSEFAWKHGHAVGWGLGAAVRLSARLGLCDMAWIARIEGLLMRWHLPTRQTGYDPDAIINAMKHDKKWQGGRTHFVLLEDAGRPVSKWDVTLDDAHAVIEEVSE